MTKSKRRWSRARRVTVKVFAGIGAMVVLGAIFLLIAIAVFARGPGVPGRTVLELNLEEGLVEHIPDDPLAGVLARRQTSVRDVVEALHRAADDDRVVGLVARVGSGPIGMARAQEVREAVLAFRQSGKPAVLFSETFGEFAPAQAGYYLATAFDQIYLQPSGDVGLTGLLVEAPFFGGTLEQLDIEMRTSQRHEYKTALETFTHRGFSPENREAVTAVVQSMFDQLLGGIAEGRRLTPEQVRETVNRGPLFGDEAVRAGLVDRLAYRDEVYDSLKAQFGERTEFLYLSRYLDRAGRPYTRGDAIALIYGVGAVQRGESRFDALSGGTSMGSETVARAFREAIEDDGVKAILFRVDSPGGSYVASDAIWRETRRARAAGKPVIVSMGNVAGSGGYFVAMAADRIVAHPATITGSIGVLAGKPVTREFWDRFGVSWDTIQVGDNATMWSAIHDYSPEERARLETNLDRIYADFVAKAAEGRNMTPEQMDRLARGRIWTGVDAQRLGLVDDLGGLTTALRLAREAAGIAPDADIHLRAFPARRPFLEQLLARGPDSSYPTGAEALLVQLVEAVRPAVLLARRAGFGGGTDVLTMPGVLPGY
ncbi:signal peptide peptidase SppA [soil metagenome]|nr:signal peptide peptidase SppA [Gemmatimonadota bacterium]